MTSTIKVDNIQKVSDASNIIKKCSATTTVGSGAGNTVVVCGSTVTIGRCGGTVALASGATQSGFGREGSVDWQTGSIKTTTFTAASGEGYFINSGSAITANLPAGSPGAIVAFSDYARNFATYNLTITPNGSEKIGGVAADAVLNVNGQAATFVYVDSTKGWVNVQNAEDTEEGVPPFIQATGGTETECGNFKIHTFTGPGTFTVSRVATQSPAPEHNIVSYMVVAGGGGGGAGAIPAHGAGAGGAGGFRELKNAPIDSYTASPLDGYPTPGNRITVTAQAYPITVGGGGPGGPGCAACQAVDGNPSVFSTITSTGGGGGSGALYSPPDSGARMNGRPGGSGGGGSSQGNPAPTPGGQGGSGNTPSVTPPQGNNGGSGTDAPPNLLTGGGGGATAVGGNGTACNSSGVGGAGATTSITGSPVARAGGGGGGGAGPSGQQDGGAGGTGGGGPGGGFNPPGSATPGTAGTANTGGGGGGGKGGPDGSPGIGSTVGGQGGSGIVVIRYKFQ